MTQAKSRRQNGPISKLVHLLRASFPHVVLVVSYVAYLILGALSFCHIENHFGQTDADIYNHQMNDTRSKIVDLLSSPTPNDEEGKRKEKIQEVHRLLNKLEEDLGRPEWKAARAMSAKVNRTWTFSSSMLFCMTTITTIGYGDIVPTSTPGRTFCVIYAVVGIPFTLLLLADIGDLLARLVIWCCQRLGVNNCSRRLRTQCYGFKPDNRRQKEQSRTENGHEGDKTITPHHNMGEGSNTSHHTGSGHVCTRDGSCQKEVPVFVIFFILVTYVCGASWLFTMIENWTFGEAMYFMIITFTTIGYGDLVPVTLYDHDAFVFCILFTLLGMSMMSLTIALLREKVVKLFTFIYAKLNLH